MKELVDRYSQPQESYLIRLGRLNLKNKAGTSLY